jgi:hypothetical protein
MARSSSPAPSPDHPHPLDVGRIAGHAERNRPPSGQSRQGRRRDPALHARDPETGRPDQKPEAFEPFLGRIKQGTNAVVNLTSGGSPFMSIKERIQPSVRFKPELASLNMGSMNFGLFPMLARFEDFKHD